MIGSVFRGRHARRGAALRNATTAATTRRHDFVARLRSGLLVDKRSATKPNDARAVRQRELRLMGIHAFAEPSSSSAMRLLCGRKTVPMSLITAVKLPDGVGGAAVARNAGDTGWIAITFSGPGGPSGEDGIESLAIRLPTRETQRCMVELLQSAGCFIIISANTAIATAADADVDAFNAGRSGLLDTDVIVLREEEAIDNLLTNMQATKATATSAKREEEEQRQEEQDEAKGDEAAALATATAATAAAGIPAAGARTLAMAESGGGASGLATPAAPAPRRVKHLSWDTSVDVPREREPPRRVKTSENLAIDSSDSD
jgi:hypothetical protein